jgi:hypothetical protein
VRLQKGNIILGLLVSTFGRTINRGRRDPIKFQILDFKFQIEANSLEKKGRFYFLAIGDGAGDVVKLFKK